MPVAHVLEQLRALAPEGAHHTDTRERFADATIDALRVFVHGTVDGPDTLRRGEADEYRAGNDGDRRERQPPVDRKLNADRDQEPDDLQRR